jgi:hypothetical protein
MTRPRILILAILSIVLLLAGATIAMANHSAVNGGIVRLLKSDGTQAGPTDAYSPKATCAGCHIDNCITTKTIATNTRLWCETEAQRTTKAATDDYGSGTAYSTHVQGVLDGNNNVYWQAYQNKAYQHGVSVGRHMNQGRNEEYTNAFRAAVGDPFFTSSLGMFGKY